jgi:hypothetical protein
VERHHGGVAVLGEELRRIAVEWCPAEAEAQPHRCGAQHHREESQPGAHPDAGGQKELRERIRQQRQD